MIDDLIFSYDEIDNCANATRFCNVLRDHGYAVVEICADPSKSQFNDKELSSLAQWEEVLQDAFNNLNKQEKNQMGKYRSEKGVAVGYREDDRREFIETHLKEGSIMINKNEVISINEVLNIAPALQKFPPNKEKENVFNDTLVQMNIVLRKIGHRVLNQISKSFPCLQQQVEINGMSCKPNENYFLELTDLTIDGRRKLNKEPPLQSSLGVQVSIPQSISNLNVDDNDDNEEEHIVWEDIEYSSSVLRLCNYPDEVTLRSATTLVPSTLDAVKDTTKPKVYGFGAHTDTSFITLGCCNYSTPGLEILDRHEKQWKSIEASVAQYKSSHCRQNVYHVIVFVGEFLQVLSNHYYMAVVHRVIAPNDPCIDGSGSDSDKKSSSNRVSCPFIIRGKNKAIVKYNNHAKDTAIETPVKSTIFAIDQVNHSSTDNSVENKDTRSTTNDNSSNPVFSTTTISSHKQPPHIAESYTGMNMKLIHLLLDKKRANCMHAHNNDSSNNADVDWILSAFPDMHT